MSSLRADVARYREDAWLPRTWWLAERTIWAVVVYRLGQRMLEIRNPLLRRLLGVPHGLLMTLTEMATGIELPPTAQIGPGLRIYHGTGLVINSGVIIGCRATLRQGVTIGARRAGGSEFPVVGDDVEFGAYAQVFGGISIGHGAKVGALSVVLDDVPAGSTAVGAPARISGAVTRESDTERERGGQ